MIRLITGYFYRNQAHSVIKNLGTMPPAKNLPKTSEIQTVTDGKYYGNLPNPAYRVTKLRKSSIGRGFLTCCSCTQFVIMAFSFTISLLSLLNMRESKEHYLSGKIILEDIYDLATSIKIDVYQAISPKVDLINSMVGYNIPVRLAADKSEILQEIRTQCRPKFESKNCSCPKSSIIEHTPNVRMFNQVSGTKCLMSGYKIRRTGPIEYINMPSFVPSTTTVTGCVKTPSFGLSEKLWGYAHNVIKVGCNENTTSDQYFSIGAIITGDDHNPYFYTISSWYLSDSINRKTCTVAVSHTGAWLGCMSIVHQPHIDVTNPGVNPIIIHHMDIYGNRVTYMFRGSEIPVNNRLDSLYFSVGSGIVVDGRVYFLMFGTLTTKHSESSFCFRTGCTSTNDPQCTTAQMHPKLNNKQMVMILLSFEDNPQAKPHLKFYIMSPYSSWFSTQGRLFYNAETSTAFIYTRSSSWHSLLQVGIINLKNPQQIFWTIHKKVTRPGTQPCTASNRCPHSCMTGAYNDFFPIGRYYELVVGVMLHAGEYLHNPQVTVADTEEFILQNQVLNKPRFAGLTTTTCFVYDNAPWCLSILEMSLSIDIHPEVFIYKLPVRCDATANMNENTIDQFMTGVEVVVPKEGVPNPDKITLGELINGWINMSSTVPSLIARNGGLDKAAQLFKEGFVAPKVLPGFKVQNRDQMPRALRRIANLTRVPPQTQPPPIQPTEYYNQTI